MVLDLSRINGFHGAICVGWIDEGNPSSATSTQVMGFVPLPNLRYYISAQKININHSRKTGTTI